MWASLPEPDFPALNLIGLPFSARSSGTRKYIIVIVLKKNLLLLCSMMTVDDTAQGLFFLASKRPSTNSRDCNPHTLM